MDDLISVVIPSYNRFTYLLNTIKSIKTQTYKNIEIIVVNDGSTEIEYYNYDWNKEKIIIHHLPENSRVKFGYVSSGFVRDTGIMMSKGKYIAFCDDDDIWFPNKLEIQLKQMKKTGCKMSSTDGLIGFGVYDPTKIYVKYNGEYFYNILKKIFQSNGSSLLDYGFPKIWTFEFLKVHNCVICSSVLIEKDILTKIGNFQSVKNGREDYDCWLKALEHTNSVYIEDACFYYDNAHGSGQNY